MGQSIRPAVLPVDSGMFEIRSAAGRKRRGFSLIELLIVIAIILILAAIAVPQYSKFMMSGRETAAIRAIQTLQVGETGYYSQFGKYAGSLAELGPPASGPASAAAADLIAGDLITGKKGGYIFTVAASPGGYAITAVPEQYNTSGRRSFYVDSQSNVIRNSMTQEPATANSPEIK